MRKINTIDLIHKFLAAKIRPGDCCIDATAGNGHDTLFLARLVGEGGRVLAFDIQPQALRNTAALLEENGLRSRADLIEVSHVEMAAYAERGSVRAVVFNLGYLPGGDHSLQTRAETTVPAVRAALELLQPGGVVALCVYQGGDSGFAEKNAVCDFVEALPYREYTVLRLELANRPNYPPLALLITKD
jgi:tRNA1(Val) A37 N6-methylase TrmN6